MEVGGSPHTPSSLAEAKISQYSFNKKVPNSQDVLKKRKFLAPNEILMQDSPTYRLVTILKIGLRE